MAKIFGEIKRDKPIIRTSKKKKKDRISPVNEKTENKQNETILKNNAQEFKEEGKREKPENEMKDDLSQEGISYKEYLKKAFGPSKNKDVNDLPAEDKSNNPSDFTVDDRSLDSIAEMAEAMFGKSAGQKKKVRDKLEIIMENFSKADKSSLWETFLKTEKEIGSFGSYLPAYQKLHDNFKGRTRDKNSINVVLLIIFLILLFKEDLWRRLGDGEK